MTNLKCHSRDAIGLTGDQIVDGDLQPVSDAIEHGLNSRLPVVDDLGDLERRCPDLLKCAWAGLRPSAKIVPPVAGYSSCL